MSVPRIASFVVAAVVAAVTIAVFSSDGPDNHARDETSRVAVHSGRRVPASRSASSAVAVFQEMDELRQQAGVIAKEQNGSLESPTAEETPRDVATHVDDDDDVSANQESPEETAERLSEIFAADGFDSNATSQAATHIADHLTDQGIGRLVDVGCGRTQCLAQVDFNDEAARDAGLQRIGSMLPWDTDGFFMSDPNDGRKVAVHFSREGYPLPSRSST